MDKKLIIGGAGLGVVALYLLTKESDGGGAGFGGGGFGGLPIGEVGELGSGESEGVGGLITRVIESPEGAFSGFDMSDEPSETPLSKKGTVTDPQSQAATDFFTSDEFSKSAGLMTMGETKTQIQDMLDNPPSKKEAMKGAPWWNPLAWDRESAVKNYESYVAGSWGSKSEQFKFGGGSTRGTEGFGGDYSPSVAVIRKANLSAPSSKKTSSTPSTSRSRGYSTMTGSNKVPGWKQVGARKPTAPGQPDRY